MKKIKLKNYVLAFGPSVIWAGVIFLFSSQEVLPGFTLSTMDFLLKKNAHMFVYAVLYYLLYHGLSHIKIKQKQKWYVAFFICLVYAFSDEFHQSLVPGRSATIRDVGYDVLGTWLVILHQFRYI